MISFLYIHFKRMLCNWRWSMPIIAALFLWLIVVADFASHYAFNMTDSVKGKIFKIRPDLSVERDTVVIFPRRDPALPDGVEHMTKHVLCLPGDLLEVIGLDFYCNGVLITRAKTHTRRGDPLPLFEWEGGPVPADVFFAGTDHPDGYDSRYFGFVPLDSATVLERKL